ncbi:MAG: MG2 domain-containing protein, partial [Flavobacteriaceae bacterium]
MRDLGRLGRAAAGAAAIVAAVLVAQPVSAQQSAREIVLSQDTDFFGGDYKTLKEVTLDECSRACVADSQCQAFTFNTKAGWCFMKKTAGRAQSFAGAVGGKIVIRAAASPDTIEQRKEALAFLPQRYIDDARRFAGAVGKLPVDSRSVAELSAAGDAARGEKNVDGVSENYRRALRKASTDGALWGRFARAIISTDTDDWREKNRQQEEAVSAAINAVLNSDVATVRGDAFAMLAIALQRQSQWKNAIRAYRASIDANPVDWVSDSLAKLELERGFRIVEHTVDSDAVSPRLCVVFSDPIATGAFRAADFVQVEGAGDIATEAEERQVCVDGVRHGERYRVTVRAGLPAGDGEKLKRNVDLDIFVRDRAPSVRFPGKAYVLPAGGEATIPVVTVNTDIVKAELVRIGDRSLARAVGDSSFLSQLNAYDFSEIRDSKGEAVWKGEVTVRRELNRDMTTAIPVSGITGPLKPGVYILTAKAANELRDEDWQPSATQWFIVTDIGIAALAGSDGLNVFARSLGTAVPIGGATVRLVALNDEILGTAKTGPDGRARLDPGLLNGEGGNAPALVVVETDAGDYAFLDYSAPGFDLTDRGVAGRPAAQALDLFAVSDRGVYRPGEDVELTALVRNAKADAVEATPLTLILRRPDGVEYLRRTVPDAGLGGHHARIELSAAAMRGQWRAGYYTDPKGDALTEVKFLVEDFQPERLDFALKSETGTIALNDPGEVSLDARFLYGAPASNLRIEGETKLVSSREIAAWPGYRFGLPEDAFEPLIQPLDIGDTTDDEGHAVVPLALPEAPPTSLPMVATAFIRVVDSGGRPVERTLDLPVRADGIRLGLKPLFDGSVEEGGNARFEVIAIDADGNRVALANAAWQLAERETRFQWYNSDGTWNYEPVTTSKRVASGTVDIPKDEPARIEAPVNWGGYEMRLTAAGASGAGSEFEAGWYVTPTAEDTPDVLKVALDKERYKVGETAVVHLTPRFAGTALVMVADDRLIAMKSVEVAEGGTDVELPVTADWGPGAYVTAMLYRPMDIDARRMPGRAVGLQWASVDPENRKLGVSISSDEVTRPRGQLPVEVKIANLKAGEKAYFTLAAVDLGILNLTRHPVPDPDGWYFGQRRLGLDIRDVYGRLIDRMQGAPGTVRSGGDGALARFDVPPPTDDLVAFHSGVVEVGPDGTATVSVDLPDFNGTVRLSVMAWSAAGVGHGMKEVIVRDPIVVSASLPKFLAPGDQSRLALDLAHVEGPAGLVKISVAGDGITIPEGADRTVELGQTERKQVLVPLIAGDVGDHVLTVRITTPDGSELAKTLNMPVRANEPEVLRYVSTEIRPGGDLTLDDGLLDGLLPGTSAITVSVGGAGDLDVPGLLAMLDRYPYGCTEQLTSRALPLVYLGDVSRQAGLPGDASVADRVRKAIPLILANQASNGGFSLWGRGDADNMWLNAYVAEFLTRAREKGYDVPEAAMRQAMDNLRNGLAYVSEFDSGGEDVAYALYVLARNGRAAIGDLRYYAEARLDNFATPMAKAQLAAALALYGDTRNAATTMRAAIASLRQDEEDGWRDDYGSALRDGAAVLTLAAETGVAPADMTELAKAISAAFNTRKHVSTQELVWLTLAANAMQKGAAPLQLDVGGQAI